MDLSHDVVQFAPLEKGTSSKSVAGRTSAVKEFNKFLALGKMKDFDSRTELELCDVSLWKSFGTYLMDWARTQTNESIAVNTAMTYLSHARNVACKKFPGNPIWLDRDSWYRDLRFILEKSMKKNKIAAGELVESKSPRIGRTLMTEISEALIRVNTPDSFENRLLII